MSELIDQQRALLDQYPDEWVLLVGDRLVFHTAVEGEVWDHWDAAWEGWKPGQPEPMVVPPYPERDRKPPPIRGRGVRPV